jgi:hypothetical protein
MASGSSIFITLAPQSANWRTQVGPARTRVRSKTVKRFKASEAGFTAIIFPSTHKKPILLGYLALSLQEFAIITFISSFTKALAINEIANI